MLFFLTLFLIKKNYFISAAELVGPKYRVITSATSSSMFAVGQMILGGVAWVVQPWRYMIMALHIPCFLIISYYWILSESVRWLLSKKKYEEAKNVLETVARVNKTHISEKSLEALMNPPEQLVSSDVSSFNLRYVTRMNNIRRACEPLKKYILFYTFHRLRRQSTS